ncbi:hypothetical protein [Pedobacter xixiisoli]|uniref:Uncharacterized protein n=1 Tax=Pedobacter xixiisoli TaxID=1476464 RepID=A0A285ZNS2_9SPHI|nr:hypothetical protein [Pedobacter xixiisoli]SOD11298.1 hypothetical protein SAMN06297358_0079 [Pedobacter xixiisoli]
MKKEKKVAKYKETIQKHIDNKDFVKVICNLQDTESSIYGYIQLQSGEFILLQVHNEFSLNGYVILPLRYIETIRCNKYDKTSNKIHRAEGTLKRQYKIPNFISLDGWNKLFLSLIEADFHVIIECEDQPEADFLIGPIQKVGKTKISILNYDPAGKLDKEPSRIKYADITSITFGDQYSMVFRKYLK